VIRLDPTVGVANALARACGVHRFAFNWGLSEWSAQYEMGGQPNAHEIKRLFNEIKEETYPWILESPRDANSQAFADLGRAYANFFASRKGTRKGPKIGRPTYRKRGGNDCFYVSNDKIKVRQCGKRGVVRLPVIGDVRMREPLRWQGRILGARVYRRADQWFIAFNVETRVLKPSDHVHGHPIVGVDLGLKTAVMPSHGNPLLAPKPLKKALRRLRSANRELHRRKKGSRNREKSRIKLAEVHQHVAYVRKDWWHKKTTDLCRENQAVVIEDLSMAFMQKNRRLSRTVSDVALGMFRPMMVYKALYWGTTLVVAARHFPSTQRCPICGYIKTGEDRLVLGDAEYVCKTCGYRGDRDRTAALNLEQYPRLEGNWSRANSATPTSMDDRTSTRWTTSSPAHVDPGSGN
jgi:putative transposase